ncbi:hypothetical protein [Janthinobacterium fluminis]|uniref:Uncharacterized protein n=1 Tax=Janthinobacterium fluminis TaxID=2987524 RepID=A0ABT5K7J0_9BURK|nr:hypothetical protein [Janthinobacterium fluminis]MDC8760968.1 hypothetical protein [Janthinobacterium fluminis]
MQWIRYMGTAALMLAVADLAAAAVAPCVADDIAVPLPASVAALPVFAAAPPARVHLSGPAQEASVAVGQARLEYARGGADTVSNEARLSALVGGNAASNVRTGSNIIDGAAFTNVAGIPVVIQNSGANVLIQNATIVNLQLR